MNGYPVGCGYPFFLGRSRGGRGLPGEAGPEAAGPDAAGPNVAGLKPPGSKPVGVKSIDAKPLDPKAVGPKPGGRFARGAVRNERRSGGPAGAQRPGAAPWRGGGPSLNRDPDADTSSRLRLPEPEPAVAEGACRASAASIACWSRRGKRGDSVAGASAAAAVARDIAGMGTGAGSALCEEGGRAGIADAEGDIDPEGFAPGDVESAEVGPSGTAEATCAAEGAAARANSASAETAASTRR